MCNLSDLLRYKQAAFLQDKQGRSCQVRHKPACCNGAGLHSLTDVTQQMAPFEQPDSALAPSRWFVDLLPSTLLHAQATDITTADICLWKTSNSCSHTAPSFHWRHTSSFLKQKLGKAQQCFSLFLGEACLFSKTAEPDYCVGVITITHRNKKHKRDSLTLTHS